MLHRAEPGPLVDEKMREASSEQCTDGHAVSGGVARQCVSTHRLRLPIKGFIWWVSMNHARNRKRKPTGGAQRDCGA